MSDAATTQNHELKARLLAGYRSANRFDEALFPDGWVRPHYGRFLQDLDRLTPREIRRRWETARRFVHEQGITYHVYGDAAGVERPWRLDPIPLIISATEWKSLEAALIQRATLLNRILADCYGPQQLVRDGRLPPALVFAQPDFVRACHGIHPPRENFLSLYAADLARAPDGTWWVVSDRTQIPTGAGYALANRLVTARVLPDSFRHCHVQRLAGFFREIQTSLAQLAAHRTDNPRVVMLTPGSYNETYFEQVYLARYLGYTLVEGQDLTIRDRHVFLKTLSGLEPVDVILRRVDDDFCDPLELRNDSMLGIPGLVEAWRAGNVAIANPLGSGLVQNPAFMAFLPGLARHILGEDLKLPSVATWWGGQKTAERYILDHLDKLYVKPAFRSAVPANTPHQALNKQDRALLQRTIGFLPHLYVGQEWVELSTAPSWHGDSVVARPVGLRVYLVASGDSYKVMPGGLGRVAPDESARFISMQRGGASKDIWVLSDGPVQEDSLLHTSNQPIELRRVGNNLPSRMADNFFWLGRYIERADSICRLLRSALVRFSFESGGTPSPALAPILATLERHGQIEGSTQKPEQRAKPGALEADFHAAIFDPKRRGSLRNTVEQMLRLTNQVRDRTSHDFWRVSSQIHDRLERPPPFHSILSGDAATFLNQIILRLASFHGLAMENMTRAQGWRFLDMGHRIERSVYLSSFLEHALLSEADDASVLEAVLEVVDNSITYRSRYNLLPHIAAVYDLVLLDEANPRSLVYQLQQLLAHFDHLPREKASALPTPAQRALLDALTRLRLSDPTELGSCRKDWANTQLAGAIQHAGRAGSLVSEAVAVSYFAHSTYSRAGAGPSLSG
ncbi:MAG: circularly permuted type 2 ATP-grasp protein [Verrucomicrobiota bacterium]